MNVDVNNLTERRENKASNNWLSLFSFLKLLFTVAVFNFSLTSSP